MLCEYLGFGGSDTSVGNSGVGRGSNMATGDLLCYKRERREASCCVHLRPYTNERLTSVEYLTCKYMRLF